MDLKYNLQNGGRQASVKGISFLNYKYYKSKKLLPNGVLKNLDFWLGINFFNWEDSIGTINNSANGVWIETKRIWI